jgi:hypothetical protein
LRKAFEGRSIDESNGERECLAVAELCIARDGRETRGENQNGPRIIYPGIEVDAGETAVSKTRVDAAVRQVSGRRKVVGPVDAGGADDDDSSVTLNGEVLRRVRAARETRTLVF